MEVAALCIARLIDGLISGKSGSHSFGGSATAVVNHALPSALRCPTAGKRI